MDIRLKPKQEPGNGGRPVGASPGINKESLLKNRVAGQKCKVELEMHSAEWNPNAQSGTRKVEMENGKWEMGNDFVYHEVNLVKMIPQVNGRTWKHDDYFHIKGGGGIIR